MQPDLNINAFRKLLDKGESSDGRLLDALRQLTKADDRERAHLRKELGWFGWARTGWS